MTLAIACSHTHTHDFIPHLGLVAAVDGTRGDGGQPYRLQVRRLLVRHRHVGAGIPGHPMGRVGAHPFSQTSPTDAHRKGAPTGLRRQVCGVTSEHITHHLS